MVFLHGNFPLIRSSLCRFSPPKRKAGSSYHRLGDWLTFQIADLPLPSLQPQQSISSLTHFLIYCTPATGYYLSTLFCMVPGCQIPICQQILPTFDPPSLTPFLAVPLLSIFLSCSPMSTTVLVCPTWVLDTTLLIGY